jgi:hypothetical protein
VWKGWTARDSPLLVALPLNLSPPFFVVHVLLFHSPTHTTQDTHTKTKERKKKTKRRMKRPQNSQIIARFLKHFHICKN